MFGHLSRHLTGGAARNFLKTGGTLLTPPPPSPSSSSSFFTAPLSSLSSSPLSSSLLPPPSSTFSSPMLSQRLLRFDASDPQGLNKLRASADQYPHDGMKEYMLLRELVKQNYLYEAAARLEEKKNIVDPRAHAEITPILEAQGFTKNSRNKMYSRGGGMEGGMGGGIGGLEGIGGGGRNGEPIEVEVVRPKGERIVGTLAFVAFYLLIFAMLYSRNPAKGGNPLSSLGVQSKAHKKSEGSEITFEDVLGCDESKAQLEEIVSYLKSPMQFLRLGATLPKGVLLVGPPGTGKTLLAKSIAGEAGVPFYYASGPDFDELYVGLGPKRVRELFEEAQANSPSIVFIDEIDTIGQRRQALHNNRDGTLNQLLTELDGFEENSGVIILAATNLLETIDPALLRSGRFDKVVDVPVPDVKGRTEILRHYVQKVSTLDSVTEDVIEKLARATVGMTGADLSNLVNQAAIKAGLENEAGVSAHQLEEAYENMLLGVGRKSAVISEESKRLTAFHEGGHALVAWVLREGGALPIRRATILPRGNALGYVAQLPDKDQTSYSRKQMLAKIAVCMAGRLSEEMIFGKDEVTSGGSSDLKQASNLAVEMVSRWGMSDELGPQYIQQKGEHGGATQEIIDKEVKKILDQEEARAREILTTHKNELFALATALLKYETLSGEQIETLLKGGSI